MIFRNDIFSIRPVTPVDLEAVLEVYRQCEDFLALGPVATASMDMVTKDIELSQVEGGIFCGIYSPTGKMIGVLDYVPENFENEPRHAFISLLMIAQPSRSMGLGKAVVEAVEQEIRKRPQVKTILSGVQVNNPQAIQFWQRNGYRIVSKPILHPDQTTAYDLRKDLAS
jgi:ribosomal protein S18 acetylase RimI-like enzyme